MADFEMFAGDSKVIEVTVKDQDGDVVNITTALVRWQAARSENATALIEKTSDPADGISIVDGAAGRFDVTLDPEDTEDLRGTLYYEAEVLDASKPSTVLSGWFTIVPALIKPIPGP